MNTREHFIFLSGTKDPSTTRAKTKRRLKRYARAIRVCFGNNRILDASDGFRWTNEHVTRVRFSSSFRTSTAGDGIYTSKTKPVSSAHNTRLWSVVSTLKHVGGTRAPVPVARRLRVNAYDYAFVDLSSSLSLRRAVIISSARSRRPRSVSLFPPPPPPPPRLGSVRTTRQRRRSCYGPRPRVLNYTFSAYRACNGHDDRLRCSAYPRR